MCVVPSSVLHILTLLGPISVGSGDLTSVRELAEAMGMGHLPVKEDTPGEREENLADTTELRKLGWFPTHKYLTFSTGRWGNDTGIGSTIREEMPGKRRLRPQALRSRRQALNHLKSVTGPRPSGGVLFV